MIGTAIGGDVWRSLFDRLPTWHMPFVSLGTELGRALALDEGGDERWIGEVVPAVIGINAHWSGLRRRPGGGLGLRPVVHEEPKVGRNDPCPCGSGKKYKKCCGAAA